MRQCDLLERDRTRDPGAHFAISHLCIHVKTFALAFSKCQTWTLPSRILKAL